MQGDLGRALGKSGLIWLLFGMSFGIFLGITSNSACPRARPCRPLGGVWAIGLSWLLAA